MSNRYWVGGINNWSSTAGSNWALTSGGAGGQAEPTSSDEVFFDANSGTVTVTVTVSNRNARNLNFTGFTGTFAGSQNISIASSLVVSSTMNFTYTGVMSFTSTSTGNTIRSNGKILGAMNINGVGGYVTLLDSLSLAGGLTITSGTLDTNTFNLSCKNFSSSNSNTRGFVFTNSIINLTTNDPAIISLVWNTATSTNFTISAIGSTIVFTDTSSNKVTVSGGNQTYGNIWFARGTSTGINVIAGSNAFNDFKDDGSIAHTIQFTAGTITTVNTFTVNGTIGNQITITSNTTGTHNLIKLGGGTILSDYLNIQHSVAYPANTWYANLHSTNNQSVDVAGSGWIFNKVPITTNTAAKIDENDKPTWLLYNDTSSVVEPALADPILNILEIYGINKDTNTPIAINRAFIDENENSTLLGYNETTGLVEALRCGSSGELLITQAI